MVGDQTYQSFCIREIILINRARGSYQTVGKMLLCPYFNMVSVPALDLPDKVKKRNTKTKVHTHTHKGCNTRISSNVVLRL